MNERAADIAVRPDDRQEGPRPNAPDVIRPKMDLIAFEVLRNGFLNITEEMAVIVRRAAYSTNVKTRGDFSCAAFDGDVNVIAQSGQPGHLISMSTIVPLSVREFGADRMRSGDIFIVNDPHRGASHLNDVICFAPIFVDGTIFGFVANLAHHVDIGGASPASLGINTDIFQEGVIIPPTRIVAGGEVNTDVLNLLLANMRAKREVNGDLRAQCSANTIGSRRVADLVERHGRSTVEAFFRELLAYTERWVDHELRALPEGSFYAESFRDDDGISDEPIKLAARITFKDGRAVLDVTGSSPQRPGPMNATRWITKRCLAYVLKCLADPRVPDNSGFLSRIEVAGPDGLVVTARPPAAVVGGYETVYRLCSTVFRALHDAVPGRIAACSKSLVVNVGFSGHNPRFNEFFCYMETIGGGNGARPTKDGPDAIQTDMQNTENAPIEEVELNYPMMIRRYALIPDSGGAGEFRGGLGIRRDFYFPHDGCSFTLMSDGRKYAPWGLEGGGEGRCARFVLDPEGEARDLPSKLTMAVPKGTCISVQTPGGGGYGEPARRDPRRIRADLESEKVSPEAARRAYGSRATE